MGAKQLADLSVGDNVFFLGGEPNVFTVQAKKENFMVATSYDDKQYTIVDTARGVCGPHDRTFNPYDFSKTEDIDKLLNDLIQKNYGIGLSKRHSTNVALVLNIPKTLQAAN